jgi:hypothetical protein
MKIKKDATHNLEDLQSAILKNVLLDPKRIVAPICVLEPYKLNSKIICNKLTKGCSLPSKQISVKP